MPSYRRYSSELAQLLTARLDITTPEATGPRLHLNALSGYLEEQSEPIRQRVCSDCALYSACLQKPIFSRGPQQSRSGVLSVRDLRVGGHAIPTCV